MKRRIPRSLPFALLLGPLLGLIGAGCVMHSQAREFNGLTGIRGEPIEYQSTTSYALHFVFTYPILGNATLKGVVDDFTAEASERGGKRVRITHTSSTNWWFILPPLSFFINPVVTTVQGDVEGSAPPVD